MSEAFEQDNAWDCDGDCECCELYDVCYKDDGEEDEEQDSGFLGSMLEAQLVRDGNELCKVCGKPIRSILNAENPNLCEEKEHKDFKRLFEVRCKIGLHDLKTRGYD